MATKGIKKTAEQKCASKVAWKDGIDRPSAKAAGQTASLQPMAFDSSLPQLPLPCESAAQAARQHSSVSQGASSAAATCAERSSSSSSARGTASQDTAVPQGASLTSKEQADSLLNSPGECLSLPYLCMCLLFSAQAALIKSTHNTVCKEHLRRRMCCLLCIAAPPPSQADPGMAHQLAWPPSRGNSWLLNC